MSEPLAWRQNIGGSPDGGGVQILLQYLQQLIWQSAKVGFSVEIPHEEGVTYKSLPHGSYSVGMPDDSANFIDRR